MVVMVVTVPVVADAAVLAEEARPFVTVAVGVDVVVAVSSVAASKKTADPAAAAARTA